MMAMTDFEITAVYETLADAMRWAFTAGEIAIETRAALEAARAAATLDGRIEGKNEAQREAASRTVLAKEYDSAEGREAIARQARHDLELAKLAVEQVRLRLRLAEVLAQGAVA